ncbi:F-box/kelch-repeat protein At3g06240 [Linum grandiflorum]
MSDYIPQDVLTRIFLRLPVKSLIRFRSVSKSWNSIISSPVFVSLYSGHHLRRRPTHFLFSIFFRLFNQILMFHPDPEDNSFPVTNDEQIHWPFPYYGNFQLVGSCNGLLCLFFRQSRALCLWNPAIQKYVTLDPPPMDMVMEGSLMNRFTAFMFGFAADEYKIVTIAGSYNFGGRFITYHGGGTDMYIYELSKNSWKKKKNTYSNSILVGSNGAGQVWYNGGVHWIGKNVYGEGGRMWKVICFDMADECYIEMGLPEEVSSDDETRFLSLTVTNTASFGLVQFNGWNNSKCWVWAMEEYGEATSWKKMLTVDFSEKLSNVRSLIFREKKEKNEHGRVIVLTEEMVVESFDDGEGRSEEVMMWVDIDGRMGKIAAVHTYRESLALL